MVPSNQNLLIISRDTLLQSLPELAPEKVFRMLARLTRSGFHLLLTAPEPERWVPTRGNVDDALNSQSELMEHSRAAGAEIEGVYYVPRSLLTQDRNREGALRDILKRYSVEPGDTTLISSSSPFLKAASRLGITTFQVTPPGKQGNSFSSAVQSLISLI